LLSRTKPRLLGYVLATGLAAMLTLGVACSDDNPQDDIATPPTITDSDDGRPPASGLDDEREEFRRDAGKKVDDLEEQIAELEQKAANESEGSREELNERIDELKAKVSEINSKLRDAELDGLMEDEGAFEDLKSDIESRLEDVRSELDDLAAELGI
jgi:septal ring factor EnvC (AmiA/AmiB activator)